MTLASLHPTVVTSHFEVGRSANLTCANLPSSTATYRYHYRTIHNSITGSFEVSKEINFLDQTNYILVLRALAVSQPLSASTHQICAGCAKKIRQRKYLRMPIVCYPGVDLSRQLKPICQCHVNTTKKKRRELDQHLAFTDIEDFEAFLFIHGAFFNPTCGLRHNFVLS